MINALSPNNGEQRRIQNERLLFIKDTEGGIRLSSAGANEMSQTRKQGTPPFFRPVREGGRGHLVFLLRRVGQNEKKKKAAAEIVGQAQGQRQNNN